MSPDMLAELTCKPCPKCGASTGYGIGEEPYPCNVCRDEAELTRLRAELASLRADMARTVECAKEDREECKALRVVAGAAREVLANWTCRELLILAEARLRAALLAVTK